MKTLKTDKETPDRATAVAVTLSLTDAEFDALGHYVWTRTILTATRCDTEQIQDHVCRVVYCAAEVARKKPAARTCGMQAK